MRYDFNIFKYIKKAIPWFLYRLDGGLFWMAPDGLFWQAPNGDFWNTGDGESRHLDWIKSLLNPLQTLNKLFKLYTDDILYHMYLTGQVIYLEHYLNDLFDNEKRRIYISDGSLVLPPFLYTKYDYSKHSNIPILYLFLKADGSTPFYLYNKTDYDVQEEFIINVPNEIPLTPYIENRIRAATNKYKQAGSIYSIVNY